MTQRALLSVSAWLNLSVYAQSLRCESWFCMPRRKVGKKYWWYQGSAVASIKSEETEMEVNFAELAAEVEAEIGSAGV